MPVCQNCGKGWTWKQDVKASFRMKCPHCDKKQYETTDSRRKGSMFAFLPLIIILPVNALFDYNWLVMLILIAISVSIIVITYPFILKLSNEQEPLW
ncbi:TIGR04104 family putative zinc finger protein [Virgibacillus doumboii]|uniref:TIGR04104 family putative zinc finger protein n=1 Tax=Virgibacillus doumboii TaxID=2697503 RepID=UPI0013DEEEFC|nr:TIGR04104 family putative zinc finger protein [Virgibacillus doumboii]